MATPHLFLLGCERSGSTWLANVLDAHPEVELAMEPFTDRADFFPGFPDRTVPLSQGYPALAREVERGYARLARAKHPLLYRRGRSPSLHRLDLALLRGLDRARRRLRLGRAASSRRHERAWLHARHTPIGRMTRKSREPRCRVTKELRLCFKAPFLAEAFPDARFAVALRHPGAQLASVLRHLELRRLRELGQSLPAFADALKNEPCLERYRGFVEGADATGLLVVWWLAHYDVLLGDLRRLGAPLCVVHHEQACRWPVEAAAELLAFCGLRPSGEVERYVEWSTRTPARSDSPLETTRDAARDAQRAVDAVDPALCERIVTVLEAAVQRGGIDPALEAYLPLLEAGAEGPA